MRVGPRCFGQDSSCPALLRWRPRARLVALTGVSPSSPRLSRRFWFLAGRPLAAPTTPSPPRRARFGLWPLRSPLLGPSMFSFSSCGYLDVSVPRVRPPCMGVTGLQPAGLPHSDTHGSAPACGSPCLFAACRVLLRLRKPRHPPSALLRFSFARDPPPWLSPPGRGPRTSCFSRLDHSSLPCFNLVCLSHYCQ